MSSSLWKCTNCSLRNYANAARCDACFSPNPNPVEQDVTTTSGVVSETDEKKHESKDNENNDGDEKENFDYYNEMMNFNQHADMPPQQMIDDFRQQMKNMDLSSLFGFSNKAKPKATKDNNNDNSNKNQDTDININTNKNSTGTIEQGNESENGNANENDNGNNNQDDGMDETELLEMLEFEDKLKIKQVRLTSDKSSKICIEYSIINERNINSTQYPVLFFIHGLMDTMKSWNVLMKQLLSYQGCMIALNLLPKPEITSKTDDDAKKQEKKENAEAEAEEEKGFDLNQLLTNCVCFLDELKICKCIWIGHNVGSFICQMAAINECDRVQKLILIGTSQCTPTNYEKNHLNQLKIQLNEWKKDSSDNEKISEYILKSRQLWDDYTKKELRKNEIDEMIQDSILNIVSCKDNISKTCEIMDSMTKFDSVSFLEYIECDCNIFVSKNDQLFDEKQRHALAVNKKIQKSMLIPVGSQGGHYFHWYRNIVNKMRLVIWDFARQ